MSDSLRVQVLDVPRSELPAGVIARTSWTDAKTATVRTSTRGVGTMIHEAVHVGRHVGDDVHHPWHHLCALVGDRRLRWFATKHARSFEVRLGERLAAAPHGVFFEALEP